MRARAGECFRSTRRTTPSSSSTWGSSRGIRVPTLRRTSRAGSSRKKRESTFRTCWWFAEAAASTRGLATRFCRTARKCAVAGIATRRWTSKGQGREGDEEPIARKIPGGNGAGADEALWLEEHDGRAKAEENHGQHRSRRSQPEREAAGHRRGGTWPDHRAKSRDHAGEEVYCEFQDSQGHAHRLRGDVARRPYVRIPRPLVQRGASPRARLSRLAAEFLRRPRKLHPGAERPVGVSGDRLHARGQDQGHEHHHDDQREERRAGPRTAQGAGVSVSRKRSSAINGTHSKDRQVAQEAEIQGARTQPLPLLRPRARLHPQVSDVPNLFPRYGAEGGNPRRRESQLVAAAVSGARTGDTCRRI